jgi:F-type H+-transporting ATPase subunit b
MRRIRPLLIAVAIGALGVVMLPSVAHAEPKGHAEEECIELLEDGKSIDDCQEAPSPILPAGNEIVWGAIAFGILLLAMLKFGLPAVRKTMAAREDRIRTDLERAESARTESETELAEYRRQLAEARTEATRILEEARQSADEVKRQIRAQAETEAGEIRARAQDDIRLAAERATADVQGSVAELAIELAEKVVERNLDRDTQIALIESYINQVGSR